MGLEKVAFNFMVERGGKLAKSLLCAKPQKIPKINSVELRYEEAFGKPLLIQDKTLNPEFVKELMKIKGSVLEKVTQIKDKMLKVMGYDSSLVKVENCSDFTMSFNYGTGVLGVSDIPKTISQLDMIALIRHELDHFEKSVGIIKCKGAEFYKKMLKQMCPDAKLEINEDFVKAIDTKCKKPKHFDAEKYSQALKKYNEDIVIYKPEKEICKFNPQGYYGNKLEESAYNVQRRFGRVFKPNYITSSDLPKTDIANELIYYRGLNNLPQEYYAICDYANLKKITANNPELRKVIFKELDTDTIIKVLSENPSKALTENELIEVIEKYNNIRRSNMLFSELVYLNEKNLI